MDAQSQLFHMNRVHLLIELALQRERPTSVPTMVLHEPTTLCNLECPSCPTGEHLVDIKERAEASHFERVLREFGSFLETYYLYNWGEPTMSKSLREILLLLSGHRFTVSLSTNFSVPLSLETLEVISRMPNLDLKIDLDGATQDIVEVYRRGAKIDIIFRNLVELSKLVAKSPVRPKRIYVQMLRFPFNAHQVEEVRNLAHRLGFEFFLVERPILPGAQTDVPDIKLAQSFGCTWMYSTVCLSPELKHMAPCCGIWAKRQWDSVERDLYDAFQGGELATSRRRKDSFFTLNPARSALLSKTAANTRGMWFEQASLKGDVCDSCAMGGEYQAKFSRILNGAAMSIAALYGTRDSGALQETVNRLVRFFRSSYSSDRARDQIEGALQMPPPSLRTRSDYRCLEAMLLPLCS